MIDLTRDNYLAMFAFSAVFVALAGLFKLRVKEREAGQVAEPARDNT